MSKPSITTWVRSVLRAGVLVIVAACLIGCAASGEDVSAVKRRHQHIIWNNSQQIQSDVDAYLMLDKPSKLSDRIIR